MLKKIVYRFSVLLIISSTGAIAKADVGVEYFDQKIKPIFQSRCIQCHSCYNSPCQLNLGSVEGLDRGLVHGFDVFDPGKLSPAPPSRLGIDRKTTAEWRNFSKDVHFMPVTQDTGDKQTNIDTSFILKLVEHKKANVSLAVNDLADRKELAENSRICPENPKKLEEHLMSRPNAGMPYGLPALTSAQIDDIRVWTEMGSPRVFKPKPLAANDVPTIDKIQGFLNAYRTNKDLSEAKRQSLVSRFIYEHLFLAHVYLHNERAPESFYNLIRSRTSCEKPDEIATRRPWDETSVPFFYCLKRVDAMIVNKTHMPYLVDEAKIQRWKDLFFSSTWAVSFEGPKGVADVAPRNDRDASNPFLVFKDIPVKARYQFLLDNAQYHVMTFVKGPVCKGNVAVNSIDEQFYVLFLKPESDLMVRNPRFVEESMKDLYLPAHKGSGQIGGYTVHILQRKARERYRVLRDQYYGREFPNGYAVEDIWNGKDEASPDNAPANYNAALTVFRHEDSASVEKGLVGATSKTVFVLDYSVFERIYYNLVVGFDVFGDATHQVHTRVYMSYTKMEAEENFLSFLPRNVRSPMRRSWYLQANRKVEELDKASGDLLAGHYPLLGLDKATSVNLPPLDQNMYDHAGPIEKLSILRKYRRALVGQFKQRLGPALIDNNRLNPDKELLTKSSDISISQITNTKEFETELTKLSDVPALNSPWVLKMPSAALLVVESPEGSEIYTMARNKEHLNITYLESEKARRNEAADTMVFFKGVMTSYPNYIFHIDIRNAQTFLTGMMAITDHASYDAWARFYGSPRTGPGSEKFWPTSDRLHQLFQYKYPLQFGTLDYNRYGFDYRYNHDETAELFKNLPPQLRKTIGSELSGQ